MSRKQPPTITNFPHHWNTTTRWDDNDIYGHLNNVVHYRLFDTAVNSFLLEQGLLDFREGKSGIWWWKQVVRILLNLPIRTSWLFRLRVARLGTSSVTYEVGLFRDGENRAAAAGHFVHVLVDKASRKPMPIDRKSRAAFEQLMSRYSKACQ